MNSTGFIETAGRDGGTGTITCHQKSSFHSMTFNAHTYPLLTLPTEGAAVVALLAHSVTSASVGILQIFFSLSKTWDVGHESGTAVLLSHL